MSQNLVEHWQCQTCFQHFPSDKKLRQHIEAFQSRVQYLISRVQELFAEIQKCSAHSGPKLSDCGASDDDDDADNLVNDDGDGHEKLLCLHEECGGKPKTLFRSWKDLLRHYTIHVQCRETCGFCGIDIHRVRKYVTHFDSCKARKEGERSPAFLSKESNAIEQRKILRESASRKLKLERSTIANTSDDAVSPQETNSRKRAREMADADPEILHQCRKRRIAEEADRDATVAINSDTSYQAPCIEDVAREIAAPAPFGNDTLIPTHLDKSTSLSSNDGTFSAVGADFLQYSLGSDETFMGDESMGAFARAPLLLSHTLDRSSSYPRQEYETTRYARAPLLYSHTMDPSIWAGHQYEAPAFARAPLLASHTIDRSSGYSTVCHYEVPAQARIPSVEYDSVGRRQSNTQLINEEMTALYGTPQTIQSLVSGAGGYG